MTSQQQQNGVNLDETKYEIDDVEDRTVISYYSTQELSEITSGGEV